MSVARRNGALAVLVAVLAGLWLALRPELPGAASSPLVLPGLDPERARSVVVQDPAGPSSVELARGEDGWRVVGREGLRAYDYAVDALLSGLAAVRRADLVSDQDSSWPVYGVGEGARRILVAGPGGTVLADVLQGEALRPGDVEGAARLGTFVRLSGETAVHRAPLVAPVRADPDAWLDTRLLPEGASEATELVLEEAGGERYVLRREGDGWTRVSGAPVPTGLAADLVGALAGAHFLEVLAPEEVEALDPGVLEAPGSWSARLVGGPARDPLTRIELAPPTEEGQVVRLAGGALVRLAPAASDRIASAHRALVRGLAEERP